MTDQEEPVGRCGDVGADRVAHRTRHRRHQNLAGPTDRLSQTTANLLRQLHAASASTGSRSTHVPHKPLHRAPRGCLSLHCRTVNDAFTWENDGARLSVCPDLRHRAAQRAADVVRGVTTRCRSRSSPPRPRYANTSPTSKPESYSTSYWPNSKPNIALRDTSQPRASDSASPARAHTRDAPNAAIFLFSISDIGDLLRPPHSATRQNSRPLPAKSGAGLAASTVWRSFMFVLAA